FLGLLLIEVGQGIRRLRNTGAQDRKADSIFFRWPESFACHWDRKTSIKVIRVYSSVKEFAVFDRFVFVHGLCPASRKRVIALREHFPRLPVRIPAFLEFSCRMQR